MRFKFNICSKALTKITQHRQLALPCYKTFVNLSAFKKRNKAMLSTEIRESLIHLTKSIGFCPTEIKPIAESGSSRQYFRIFAEGKITFVGAYNANVEENEAFFYLDQHFDCLGMNVPKILCINDERTCYLQTDLGVENLFDRVKKRIEAQSFDEETLDLYRQVLLQLISFQIDGHIGLNYSKAFPEKCFNKQAILDDLNYFKYYFLKPHEELVFNESKLNNDFEKFADFLVSAPNQFFMYRDFQSRNIMIHDNKPYFIDFQGGRQGPLQYDIISLLYQVKAQIPQKIRNLLINSYKDNLSKRINIKDIEFDKYFQPFVYLRLMQVLGAYGFRGLIQKKPHFFESIPFALIEMENQLHDAPLALDLPELHIVLGQLNILKRKYPVQKSHKNDVLTITVNSFSYRKGYPDDFSGNGGGFVFDCRALPNPGREERFKSMTGRDIEVITYLKEKSEVIAFLTYCENIISQSVNNYIKRDFKNLMISFGCTGGQHRSVFFAQTIFDWLKIKYPQINLQLHHIAQKIDEHYEA
jgi:Predicted P-loop-containing kinase